MVGSYRRWWYAPRRRVGRYDLIGDFKRLGAMRRLVYSASHSARLMEADERTVKAALYRLHHAGGRTRELEDPRILHALVRKDDRDGRASSSDHLLLRL